MVVIILCLINMSYLVEFIKGVLGIIVFNIFNFICLMIKNNFFVFFWMILGNF